MNTFDLSRKWFNFCFDNPEIIRPIHTAIYFFSIEHCNRLGWKNKFGFPSQMVMEAIGVRNWRTYSAALNDLVNFGFITMIEVSKNQYSSNIISLNATVKNTKAPTKALDKALQKHSTKHSQSTVSIDKQYNKKQYNKKQEGLILPYETENFKNAWMGWIQYKEEEFNFKYKGVNSEQIALKQLSQMCDTEKEAIKIIENSIANGWKGFYKPEKGKNEKREQLKNYHRAADAIKFTERG